MRYTFKLVIPLTLVIISTMGSFGNERPVENTTPIYVKRYELEDHYLKYSEEGREFLSYLVECAFPEDVEVNFELEGRKYEYQGGIGLAPGWLKAPLTKSEQRWVSACILARTNYYGRKVEISMRMEHSDFEHLQVSKEERDRFTIYEGDFWGNLFSDSPTAYACRGVRTAHENSDPVLQKRVCTTNDENLSTSESQFSRCGFILTSGCGNTAAGSGGNQKFQEHISVYLKPENSN